MLGNSVKRWREEQWEWNLMDLSRIDAETEYNIRDKEANSTRPFDFLKSC